MTLCKIFAPIAAACILGASALPVAAQDGYSDPVLGYQQSDQVYPGGVKNYHDWTEATVALAIETILAEDPIEWTVDVCSYVSRMLSITLGYQLWEQEVAAANSAPLRTCIGVIYVGTSDDNKPITIVATGRDAYTTYGNIPLVNIGYQFVTSSVGVMQVRNNNTAMPYVSNGSGNIRVGCASTRISLVGLGAWNVVNSGYVDFRPGYAAKTVYANPSPAYNAFNAYVAQWTSANNQSSPVGNADMLFPAVTIPTDTDYVDRYLDIYDSYDDNVHNLFPFEPRPLTDDELAEHPDDCCCFCHGGSVDVQWPTYNVQDIPEPSDFDFSVLDTIDMDSLDTLDLSAIPGDLLDGVGFWASVMDIFVDNFGILTYVLIALTISFVLYLVWR